MDDGLLNVIVLSVCNISLRLQIQTCLIIYLPTKLKDLHFVKMARQQSSIIISVKYLKLSTACQD